MPRICAPKPGSHRYHSIVYSTVVLWSEPYISVKPYSFANSLKFTEFRMSIQRSSRARIVKQSPYSWAPNRKTLKKRPFMTYVRNRTLVGRRDFAWTLNFDSIECSQGCKLPCRPSPKPYILFWWEKRNTILLGILLRFRTLWHWHEKLHWLKTGRVISDK